MFGQVPQFSNLNPLPLRGVQTEEEFISVPPLNHIRGKSIITIYLVCWIEADLVFYFDQSSNAQRTQILITISILSMYVMLFEKSSSTK